jgi:hypothetical protein
MPSVVAKARSDCSQFGGPENTSRFFLIFSKNSVKFYLCAAKKFNGCSIKFIDRGHLTNVSIFISKNYYGRQQ